MSNNKKQPAVGHHLEDANVQCSEHSSCKVIHKKEVEFGVGHQTEEDASAQWEEPAAVLGACCPVMVDRRCLDMVGRHEREGLVGMPCLAVDSLHLLKKVIYMLI